MALEDKEGAGNAGCTDRTRSLVCNKKTHECSHHRYAEQSDIPCAMVLRLIRGLLGVPGFLATVAPRKRLAKLDPSVGGPGPHDFAVRASALRLVHAAASIASRPRFVTIAKRPSSGLRVQTI